MISKEEEMQIREKTSDQEIDVLPSIPVDAIPEMPPAKPPKKERKRRTKETKPRNKKAIKKNGKILVNKTLLGKEETSEEMLEVRVFETEPAVVSIGYGLTISLGNFESAKISVGVDYPCYSEEVEEVLNQVRDFVTSEINKEKDNVVKSKQTNTLG